MNNFPSNLSDAELKEASAQLFAAVNAAPATYGATGTQADDFKTKRDSFVTDLTAHTDAQAIARSKTQAKEASRDELEAAIRFLVQQAKLHGTSNANLAAAGIPVGSDSALPTTATVPVFTIDNGARFKHTINFADQSTPDIKRTPRGVLGAEVFQKIGGAAPVNETECLFRGLDTQTPYTWEFNAEDIGKMAYYMLRWRFRDGSAGDWSETIGATVTG